MCLGVCVSSSVRRCAQSSRNTLWRDVCSCIVPSSSSSAPLPASACVSLSLQWQYTKQFFFLNIIFLILIENYYNIPKAMIKERKKMEQDGRFPSLLPTLLSRFCDWCWLYGFLLPLLLRCDDVNSAWISFIHIPHSLFFLAFYLR